jgi:excisionase family DNA binding protein
MRTGEGHKVEAMAADDREKLLLDVGEVIELIGCGRSHLYRYILSGELKTVKLGRRRKIPVTAVHEFIRRLQEESTEGGAAGPPRWPR